MTTLENPLVYVEGDDGPRKPNRAMISSKRYVTLQFAAESVRIPWHRIEKIVSNHEE